MDSFIKQVFAADGLLAKRLPQYELREGQMNMAQSVLDTFESQESLAVQAGTGLGKTFAYLVPAALYAVKQQKCVVISTGTLSLQSQIIDKDIPALLAIFGEQLSFEAVLVKGRRNYICMRKLTAFSQANLQQELYREPGDANQWHQIADIFFDKLFINGDRDEIPFQVSETLWADLGSESDFCLKSKCPFYTDCFFYKARLRQKGAELLITNHALFFSDLAIRYERIMQNAQKRAEAEDFAQYGEEQEASDTSEASDAVLVNYDAVIFDEAQSLEDFASDCFTDRFNMDRLNYLARTTAMMLKPGGLLGWHDELDFVRIDGMFATLIHRAEDFFHALVQRYDGERTVRFREPHPFEEELSVSLEEIAAELHALVAAAQNDEQKNTLNGLSLRAQQAALSLQRISEMPQGEDYAYWLDAGERQINQIRLASCPVSIADFLGEGLFTRIPCVLTSATLASELVTRLGVEKPTWLRLDSPFNYRRHTRLYLPFDAPEASTQNELAFAGFIATRIPELTAISKGRAFILFTSYRAMQTCHYQCADIIRDQGWLVLMQGEKRREQLLAEFSAHGNAVLFAVSSFWEGVDVPGDALSLVVIVKLPFAVPTEPLQQARMEALEKNGENPFNSYTVPQAVLRLKQGFGRLIRTKQDLGVIAILDKRIQTKHYGARFLRDLPPAPHIASLEEVAEFFYVLEEARKAMTRGEEFTWPTMQHRVVNTSDRFMSSSETYHDIDLWPQDENDEHNVYGNMPNGKVSRGNDVIVFDDLDPAERRSKRYK